MNVAENIVLLKNTLAPLLIVKGDLIKRHTNGKEAIRSDDPNWPLFIEEYNVSLNKETEVEELKKLKKTDIDLDRAVSVNIQGFIALLLSNGLLE